MRKITQLRRSLPVPVLYRHTDRANNAVADWLTNVSRELGCSCTVNPGSFHLGDPVPWSADQASAHVREIHLRG